MKPRESQDAPFSHPCFGEEGALNLSSILSNIVLSFILNHLMIVSSSITTSQGLSAALGSVADLLMMACSLAQ